MSKTIEIESLCFWCGQPRGKTNHDLAEGDPVLEKAIISYEPCTPCVERFSKGVTLFETKKAPYYDKQPPLFKHEGEKEGESFEVFPSGRWATLPVEAVSTIFEDKVAAEYKKTRQGYVDEEAYKLIRGAGDQPTRH